jgi:hypothetical protein
VLQNEINRTNFINILNQSKFGGAFQYMKSMRPEMQQTLLMRLICKAEAYIFFVSLILINFIMTTDIFSYRKAWKTLLKSQLFLHNLPVSSMKTLPLALRKSLILSLLLYVPKVLIINTNSFYIFFNHQEKYNTLLILSKNVAQLDLDKLICEGDYET